MRRLYLGQTPWFNLQFVKFFELQVVIKLSCFVGSLVHCTWYISIVHIYYVLKIMLDAHCTVFMYINTYLLYIKTVQG